jgi:NADPH:quinone reductase-like Zn-dependent oxidoreductase
VQIAAALGATIIATSSSEEKLALAKKIGATHTINYKTHPEWSAEVLRITGGKGVDHVVEVGGAGTILESLKSTRYGGQVSICGILTPPKEEDLVPHIMYGAKTGM